MGTGLHVGVGATGVKDRLENASKGDTAEGLMGSVLRADQSGCGWGVG